MFKLPNFVPILKFIEWLLYVKAIFGNWPYMGATVIHTLIHTDFGRGFYILIKVTLSKHWSDLWVFTRALENGVNIRARSADLDLI